MQDRCIQHHRENKGCITSTSNEDEDFTECNAALIIPCKIPGGCSRHRQWWAFKEQMMNDAKTTKSYGDTTYRRLLGHQYCPGGTNPEHKKEAISTKACNHSDQKEQHSTEQPTQVHVKPKKANRVAEPNPSHQSVKSIADQGSQPSPGRTTHLKSLQAKPMTHILDSTSRMRKSGMLQKRRSTKTTQTWL